MNMDPLYFKTNSKASVLSELGLHEDPERENGKYFNGSIYQGEGFLFAWIGRIVDTWKVVEDIENEEVIDVPDTYKDGYYFNIWVSGQDAMDRYYNLSSAERIEPETPNLTLF